MGSNLKIQHEQINAETVITICSFIKDKSGIKLDAGKTTFIESRLASILHDYNIPDWYSLNDKMLHEMTPDLEKNIVNALTTNKTEFFRESNHFEFVTEYIEDKLKSSSEDIFILSAACSYGQEVYSLFMHARDVVNKINPLVNIRVLGVDIDSNVIECAKIGVFDASLVETQVQSGFLSKYFLKGNGGNSNKYKFNSRYMESIKFRKLNLLESFSFPVKFDLIFIRNVLIYFDNLTIEKVIFELDKEIKPEGLLVLGNSETLNHSPLGFSYLGHSVYKKKEEKPKSIDKLKHLNFDEKIVAIGASTGGPEAIEKTLEMFPENFPATVIVLHMPDKYACDFANRLNDKFLFRVKIAEHGEVLSKKTVYIAPGGKHLTLVGNSELKVKLSLPKESKGHVPSVNYFFSGIAKLTRYKVFAAILTGMGCDGAEGILDLKNLGHVTFGQDEKSSVVYGMPRAAEQIGALSKVGNLTDLNSELLEWFEKNN